MADTETHTRQALRELRGEDLRAADLAAGIAANGAIIVRGMVSDADAAQLDWAFNQTLNAAQQKRAERDPDWFTPFNDGTENIKASRAWVRSQDCLLMADSPAMLRNVSEIYRRSGILDLVTAHLGEEPVLSSQKSTLRRTLGNKVYTDNWHQDGAFLGPDARVVNVWLALTPCGEHAASVEVALTRQTGIVPTGGEGSLFYWTVSPGQAAISSPQSVAPVCAPGDALLFDHLCLHRTSISPDYTQERRALETWFFAPSTYPHEFDPRPIRL